MYIAVSRYLNDDGEHEATRIANKDRLAEHAYRNHKDFDYYQVGNALKIEVEMKITIGEKK